MEILQKNIKRNEGLSLEPYLDTRGFLTVGFGHKLKEKCGPISLHEADELLREDLYHASDKFMRWRFSHNILIDTARARVVIELIFWVGYRGFLRFRKMLGALEKQDYHLAALEVYNSELGKKYSKRARELAETLWG